jgi:alcohol dehydrogenase (cytochrome c)
MTGLTTHSFKIGVVGLGVAALMLATSATAQDFVTDEMLLEADKDPNNWLMAPRDYAGTRYSPLAQVNTDSIGRLVPKWTFSFGVLDAQNTTPVVNNGVMYATASHGRTYAIDARTGDEIWRYVDELPEGVAGNMCCDIGNRGVALYHDKVYVATPDSDVVALDAKTGEVAWHVNIGNWEEAYLHRSA